MIEVINIKKQYNGEPVLKGINFTIQDGDFVSIMGKSGSGKSTLINIIGGFLSPDEGSIKFDGRDISKFSDKDIAEFRSKETGFVFQSFKLISTLTAYDNVILPAVLGGMDEKKIDENVDMLVEKFGLQEVMNKYPDQMSGGQCQRTAIVRALAFNPKTIILDEPTGALDSKTEEDVMKVLADYNREYGTTIVQVTHSQKVANFSKKIITIKDGQLCE